MSLVCGCNGSNGDSTQQYGWAHHKECCDHQDSLQFANWLSTCDIHVGYVPNAMKTLKNLTVRLLKEDTLTKIF
jgi:hypothetical protein